MSRIRTILTVGALTAGLIGGAVPAALAGTTPSPADTPAFGGGEAGCQLGGLPGVPAGAAEVGRRVGVKQDLNRPCPSVSG